MRTELELLKVLRDRLPELMKTEQGFCNAVTELNIQCRISVEEDNLLFNTLFKHRTKYRYKDTGYWFKPFALKVRVKYIDKLIKIYENQ